MTTFAQLLQTEARLRQKEHYEAAFDNFVNSIGGSRLTDVVNVPDATKNADYILANTPSPLIIELKQIDRFAKDRSAESYFREMYQRGEIYTYTAVSPNAIQITPASLSTSQWNRFYRKFRPSVAGALDKAALQLRHSSSLLKTDSNNFRFGIFLVNTGDFNMPIDLMFRLTEFHCKKKWKFGQFSFVDFVFCLGVDLVQPGQVVPQPRCLVRNVDDKDLMKSVRYIFDRWVIHLAEAMGAEIEFVPGEAVDIPLNVGEPILGKLIIEK